MFLQSENINITSNATKDIKNFKHYYHTVGQQIFTKQSYGKLKMATNSLPFILSRSVGYFLSPWIEAGLVTALTN